MGLVQVELKFHLNTHSAKQTSYNLSYQLEKLEGQAYWWFVNLIIRREYTAVLVS